MWYNTIKGFLFGGSCQEGWFMAVYVVSDLHGQYDLFVRGLERIGFSGTDKLYVIGDAIDRGPDGIKILQKIFSEDNMELLMGNHEFMMLNSVDPEGEPECYGRDSNIWLHYNGGEVTFKAYCELPLSDRKELLDKLSQCYLIRILEISGRKICLTHSYYDETCVDKKYCEMSYDQVSEVVWKNPYRTDSHTHGDFIYENYDYTFVSGHVPVQRLLSYSGYSGDPGNPLEPDAFKKGNYINIDGGLAMGRIKPINMKNGAVFLRLDDMEVFAEPMEQLASQIADVRASL